MLWLLTRCYPGKSVVFHAHMSIVSAMTIWKLVELTTDLPKVRMASSSMRMLRIRFAAEQGGTESVRFFAKYESNARPHRSGRFGLALFFCVDHGAVCRGFCWLCPTLLYISKGKKCISFELTNRFESSEHLLQGEVSPAVGALSVEAQLEESHRRRALRIDTYYLRYTS